jgi:uridine kinase
MKEIVKQNIKIERQEVPIEEAGEYFKKKKFFDKVRLLKYRKKPYLVLYCLGEHRDYHHGYMVPSTSFLKWFDLIPQPEGFILQYPRRSTPTQLFEMPQYSKLLAVFKQYNNWLSGLGIDSVGALNESIEKGTIRQVILVSEAQHEQKIAHIAQQIATSTNDVRVVLIAGPSSSGKTFFSKRLAIQLLALSIEPFAFELDNYFVDRDKTPKDEKGNFDFESIDAINREILNKHIEELIKGKEVQLLHYNFEKGKSELGEKVQLKRNQLIILEGIHGLNPQLLQSIPPERTFKIYISCLTQLNLDRYNRISTTDTRMLRRIIRDATQRGYSAQRTIQMWESVRRGERNYIFPYQEFANEMFNSALVYELSVLKPYVEPLLRQIPHGIPEYLEAKRMLAVMEWFLPINDEIIPYNSILREFIGNSILGDFRLWEGLTESHFTSA